MFHLPCRAWFTWFAVLTCGCANQALLNPSAGSVRAPGAQQVKVSLGGAKVVEIWRRRCIPSDRRPSAYVLRFCDNDERAEDAVQNDCAQWDGYAVEIWAMNYPGFGGSSGPAALAAIPPAALAAYETLHSVANGKPIFISGRGIGAATALYVGANRPTSGLLLYNAPPIRELFAGQYGWWNLGLVSAFMSGQVPRELDSVANARRATAPAIFVIAALDQVVPRPYQRRVTGSYAGDKRVIVDDEAGHDDPIGAAAEKRLQADIRWLWTRARSHPSPTTHR